MSFVEKRVWSYTSSTVQIKKALLAIYSYESWTSAKNLRSPPSNFKWPFSPVFKSIPPPFLLPSSLSKPPNYKNPPPSFSPPPLFDPPSLFRIPSPSFKFPLPLSKIPYLFQIPPPFFRYLFPNLLFFWSFYCLSLTVITRKHWNRKTTL